MEIKKNNNNTEIHQPIVLLMGRKSMIEQYNLERATKMKSARKDSLTPQLQKIHDLTIRARNVTLEIVEASEEKVTIKSNCAGQVNGSLYSGSYNDTVEADMSPDGTLAVTIRYLHMTQSGELVWGAGAGKRGVPNPNGMAKLNAEGIMWTSSPRLSQLNGKRWVAEGDYNIKEESFEVIQQVYPVIMKYYEVEYDNVLQDPKKGAPS
jgi:hypothetical protein